MTPRTRLAVTLALVVLVPLVAGVLIAEGVVRGPAEQATFVLAALVAGAAGLALGRLVTAPLGALGAAAERVAAGDLEAPIPASGDEAVDRVATALTGVAEDLRRHVAALEQSRSALRTSLGRLGDTLSSTHDLGRILSVSLDSAVGAVGARAGAVLLSSGRAEVAVRAASGLEGRLPAGVAPTDVRVPLGAGVVGRVAQEGRPLRGSLRTGPDALVPDPREPLADDVIAVPLRTTAGHRRTEPLRPQRRAPLRRRRPRRRCRPSPTRPPSPSTTSCCTRRRSGCRSPTG